jgi:hypothetical protein
VIERPVLHHDHDDAVDPGLLGRRQTASPALCEEEVGSANGHGTSGAGSSLDEPASGTIAQSATRVISHTLPPAVAIAQLTRRA